MKTITIDYDQYTKEINDSREKGFSEGLELGTHEGQACMVSILHDHLNGDSELINIYIDRCCHTPTSNEIMILREELRRPIGKNE